MRNIDILQKKATGFRRDIVKMICNSKSGHPGGSLSIIEILTALYFSEMKIDPENPKMENRDRFILSKGHAAPAIYAILADKGFFDKKELKNLRKYGSILQGHPDMKKVPGVDMSTGSLGQGLSVANGMAIAFKIDKKDNRVNVILGDGELQEGQIWEAALTAAHQKLDNLIAFVDYNNLQIDGKVSEIKDVYPIADKFKAFGWNTIKIDGHDFNEIFDAIDNAKQTKGKPTLVVANTIKGKGVSFMENICDFHGKAPSEEETKKALDELS